MRKIIMLVIATTMFVTVNVFAGNVNSEKTKITMIRGFNATSSKGLYITIDKAIPNPKNCSNTGMIRAAESDIADFDQQFSMLLAAFMSGKEVIIQVSDETCVANYPFFVNVLVYQ